MSGEFLDLDRGTSVQKALPRLYTLPEVAHALLVSQKTVRRQVAAGRIPCVRIGRRLLFDARDVTRFVAAAKE